MPGSVAHQLLAVASATPRHWFELEELATRRGLRLCDKSSITMALKTLANHGFLKRHQGQLDGNVQRYTLTSEGEGLLDELHVEDD
ncbi:helix-turn-helix transcriptional regulator [Deinococcus alpinitundrae]|uniref:helix-turn-helix transcriptional regulator n=1 Tax=Deinococcus alpinitundrae TaxID=468913 RepID=UPI001379FD02|nr:helix-turn-helix transcriptional regulator [Deinococcus alpinitundrae]